MRKAIWVSVGCVACIHGGLAWGARGFRPQVEQLTGMLQLRAEYRKTSEENDIRQSQQTRQDFRETLQIQTKGFSYSPKFFTFTLSGGIGLGQSEMDLGERQASTKSAVEEYHFQGIFLPQHPYNLELYSFRELPLFTSNYSTFKTTSVQSSGMALSYKEKPYFGEMRYDFSEREGDVPSFFETYQGYVEYFTDEFVTGMSMTHTNDILKDRAARESYYDGHTELHDLFSGKGEYSGTWSFLNKKRDDSESRTGSLRHYLDVDIRDDLDGVLEFMQDRQSNFSPFADGQEVATSGLQDGRMLLTHRLYKSLTTAFTAREKIREASDSTNRYELLDLTSTYRKRLPQISRVTLSAGVANAKTSNDIIEGGAPFIAEAFFDVSVGRSFTTTSDIDQDTLHVAVLRDPNFQDDYVELEERVHYRIRRIRADGSLEIELRRIPEGITPLLSNGELRERYRIRTRYETIKSDDDAKALTWKYTTKLELLDNFMELYYNRNTTRQERTSLQPSLVLLDDIVLDDNLGMVLRKDPFSIKWDYYRIVSDQQTLRKWTVVSELRDELPLAKHLALEYEGYGENTNIFEDRTSGVTMPNYNLLELYTNIALATEIPSLEANLKCGVSYTFNRDLKEHVQFYRPGIEGIYIPDEEMTRTLETDSSLRNYIMLDGAIPEQRLFYSLSGSRILSSGIDDEKGWELISRIRYELGLVKMKLTMLYDARERTDNTNEVTNTEETQATLTVSRDLF